MTPMPIVHQVSLTDLAHIRTRTGPAKLAPVERLCRLSASTMPPIWLYRLTLEAPLALADGNHRLTVSRLLNFVSIPAYISNGPDEFAGHCELYDWGLIGMAQSRQRDRTRAQAMRQREHLEGWLRDVLTTGGA